MSIQPIRLGTLNDPALVSDAACCGGSACGVTPGATASIPVSDTSDRSVLVDGMTCDHCVRAVTEELSAVEGVSEVSVALVVGGSSRVSFHADPRVDDDAVRAAVEEAGYRLA